MTIAPMTNSIRPLNASDRSGLPQAGKIKALTESVARGLPSAPSMDEQLRQTAQKWVGQAFFGTLMRQMENSPFKSDVLSGGRGGEAFSSMLHQQLAERAARGAGTKLSDAIVKRVKWNLNQRKAA